MSQRLLADVHARAGSSDATKLAAVSEYVQRKNLMVISEGVLATAFSISSAALDN
jgi:hypothetical protein